ncbi:Hint domain-containing protein, partial [Phaeobacter italicus]|uniref:Hint domain-containing protein n=1 Tax=Phaeobacter italicus TaxID=481446 RepID=UPI00248DF77D
MNQSTATANGGTEDYSGSVLFQSGDSIFFDNVTRDDFRTDTTGVACFTKGTRILTSRGQIAVEDLAKGDLVMTRDNGLQPLR